MTKELIILNGHPDPRPERFCAALCDAYERGAKAASWMTRRLDVGRLGLGALAGHDRNRAAQEEVETMLAAIRAAGRLVVVFPLWVNEPPEMLQTLFHRLACMPDGARPSQTRVIVTMELPALMLKATKDARREIDPQAVTLPGIVIRDMTVIGCVNSISLAQRKTWLDTVEQYGKCAA